MTEKEIAMHITLKAIENGFIFKNRVETKEESNEISASETAKFYKTIYKAVSNADKD